MKALVMKKLEGIENIQLKDIEPPSKMGPEDLIIKHTFASAEFEDMLIANKEYGSDYSSFLSQNGMIMGLCAVGIVEKKGSKVTNTIKEGEKVFYSTASIGAFCEKRVIHNTFCAKYLDYFSSEIAFTGTIRKAILCHNLLFKTMVLKQNTFVMVNDASSPTEQILCRWAKSINLKVIGTVNDDSKKSIATACGCELVVNYKKPDAEQIIKEHTKDHGIDVIFDSTGAETILLNLKALATYGAIINYGHRTGRIKVAIDAALRSKSGFIMFPTLEHYKYNKTDLAIAYESILGNEKNGVIIPSGAEYELSEYKKVYDAMQNANLSEPAVFRF